VLTRPPLPARLRTALLLTAILCSGVVSVTSAASSSAETERLLDPADWDSDGWLGAIIGPERLAAGDEFGCHGIPDLDARQEPAVFAGCRDYVESMTAASRWGSEPLSFGLSPGELSESAAAAAQAAGFRMVSPAVAPPAGSTLVAVPFSAGSLEKNIADQTLIEQALEEAGTTGLVSLTWQARIGDLNVRKDRGVIDWLESQQVWFTTWGEWLTHSESSARIHRTDESNASNLIFVNPMVDETSGWLTPGTILVSIDANGPGISTIVHAGAESLPELNASARHLTVGWRRISTHSVVVTAAPDSTFEVILSAAPESNLSVIESNLTYITAHFNAMPGALAVAGLHTIDLLEWASGFDDSPLRFTWLVEPQRSDGLDWRLVGIAVVTLLASVATMLHLVRRDRSTASSLGPRDDARPFDGEE